MIGIFLQSFIDFIIYNILPHFLQRLIFEKSPPNIRKIVLATNMAEASITINDIVFVVDCGKAKETTYDALNNTPCLLPSWISQASARQVSFFVPWSLKTFYCWCIPQLFLLYVQKSMGVIIFYFIDISNKRRLRAFISFFLFFTDIQLARKENHLKGLQGQ